MGHDIQRIHIVLDTHIVLVFLVFRKAIVWKNFKKAYVLEGHTAAVLGVLGVDNDVVLTGNDNHVGGNMNHTQLISIYIPLLYF